MRRVRMRLVGGVVAAALSLWSTASPATPATSARVGVARISRTLQGPEALLVSAGSYAEGIDLDAVGEHARALRAYTMALTEVGGLADLTKRGRACVPLLRA